ncbi:hypothetical protein Tco_0842542 [Tanacetum coccineum]|uniref:Uncharacterized protein n=1 Tax=Tanacetum coccineum TaxID=301880 RepID=A0ABQ5B030_9ASTR
MDRTMLIFGGRGTSTQVSLSMRVLYSSHIAYFQLGSHRAWKGDLGMGEEVVTWELYLGLAFIIPTLECVTIGCCEVDSGGGGSGEVFGGGVFGCSICLMVMGVATSIVVLFEVFACGLYVSHGAEGKDSFVKYDMTRNDDFVGLQVKAPIAMMICKGGPRKIDVWDVIVDKGGGDDIKEQEIRKVLSDTGKERYDNRDPVDKPVGPVVGPAVGPSDKPIVVGPEHKLDMPYVGPVARPLTWEIAYYYDKIHTPYWAEYNSYN